MSWGYFGSQFTPEYEEMKSLTGSQGVVLVSDLLGLSSFWEVSRQNIRRKIKSWIEKKTSSTVAWSLWYTEAGSRVNLWP
jgi:hypothetical protein